MIKYSIEKAPHVRSKDTTFRKMMEFLICVAAIYLAAVIFYFVKGGINYDNVTYGMYAIQNGLIGVAFSVIPDFLFNIPMLFNKHLSPKERWKMYFYKIGHSYSYVSGLLLVLLLPIGPEWWEIAVTAFISTFVMKLLFGGFGSNIFNPAIFGRVFAQICFASDLTTYLPGASKPNGVISAGASITSMGMTEINSNLSFFNMFFGNYYGSLGETFAFLIIIAGIYLSIRKIIDYRTSLTFVGAIFLAALLVYLFGGYGANSFEFAVRFVMQGGVLFGAVFCLTDPVTTPTSRSGRMIFALGAAIVTLAIRLYTNNPEGVAYSILLMNAFTPLIDKVLVGRTSEVRKPAIILGCLTVTVLAIGLSFGITHPLPQTTALVSVLKEVRI
ncbi:MAG: RnfABCDGE type electron transport complex subunit D [Bacilli bacterium]